MPVEFLSDEQVAAYGWFAGEPKRAELERFFFLQDVNRELDAKHRGEHNRLGFTVQLLRRRPRPFFTRTIMELS